MNSQVSFVMHPEDEEKFFQQILADEQVVLIGGPRWKTASPTCTRSISDITGNYCIIWSPSDLSVLKSRHIAKANDWYCSSEYATIQFLRSEVAESVVTRGRIAISTDHGEIPGDMVKQIVARYNTLRKYIKTNYDNSLARWFSPNAPILPAAKGRSANPGKMDKTLWIGPKALQWLRSDGRRRIRAFKTGGAEALIQPVDPDS